MKRLSKSMILAILLSSFLIGFYLYSKESKIEEQKAKTDYTAMMKEDSLKSYREILASLKSDLRLRQHFEAVKYSKLEPTKENIKAFLKATDSSNSFEAFGTALLETANGKTGVGREPINNHFGMKNAGMRFSWKSGLKSSGYCIYDNWCLSYLDFIEYKKMGYATWQKSVNKLAKANVHKAVTKHHNRHK